MKNDYRIIEFFDKNESSRYRRIHRVFYDEISDKPIDFDRHPAIDEWMRTNKNITQYAIQIASKAQKKPVLSASIFQGRS